MLVPVNMPPAESTDFGVIIKPAANTKQTTLILTKHRFLLIRLLYVHKYAS